MDFFAPYMTGWLLLLPLILGLLFLSRAERRRALRGWGVAASAAGKRSSPSRVPRNFLFAAALTALVLALADPRGPEVGQIVERRGADVVFVLDLSKSMLAADVKPDRLRRATLEIERMLEALRHDRVALVVFAGSAFMQAPLTTDHAVLRNFMRRVSPLDMPYPGSNLGAGLMKALSLLERSSSGRNQAIIVFTDGEQTAGNARVAAQEAAERKIPLYIVAVGDDRGEPIPTVGSDGRPDVLRDSSGKPVISRIDEVGLRELASISNGRYARAAQSGSDNIVQVLSALEREVLEQRTVSERSHLYSVFALPALLFLMVGLWFDERATAS